ncbi:MAG TPA: methyltransferase domain-containing protein [Anaerolineales bacterium]|nr:methyltransferase domain-containing protein [Anaerolineales bacterium]
MSSVQSMPADSVASQRDAFMERFLQFASGTFNMFSIYIGDRLGLYRVLAEGGPATSAELASRTGTHERYIREWLEQQTVAGILEVEDETQPAESRRFRLPEGHAEPLVDHSSLNYIAPIAQLIAGAVRPLPSLLEAYRKGGGIPFEEYGTDLREGQAAINYPAFMHQLPTEWLPAMADIHARLQSEPSARVADIGCGYGWSSIGIAKGYPNIHVDGFDLDAPSIERARENARQNGLSERVQFQVRDASDPALAGQYDLVTAFECVHDMSDPVGALRTMRRLVKPNGAVLIVDERVGDTFTAKGNDVEWMMYGWSILHCLPVGMVGEGAAGTGTVMRTGTLRAYATEAGFSDVEILPIENFFFRFYRLNP